VTVWQRGGVNEWGRRRYGDPCEQCAFVWSITEDDAVAVVGGLPARGRTLLTGRSGRERHPDLGWTASGYVCHVVDNLRIWAERLAAAAAGSDRPIGPYDSDLLAAARAYDAVPVAGALWSLARAAADWATAVAAARDAGVELWHPERGTLSVGDVVRSNAHDCWHHLWDIARSIPATAVFLPGMTGRGQFWQPVADALPDTWTKQFVDWPGLGDVPADPGIASFDDLADLVVDRLEAGSIVVARSMGGVVAVHACLRAPDRMSHLVLSATSGGVDVEALGAQDWRHTYRRRFSHAPAWAFERPRDLSDELRRLDVPTLLIWGTDDPISPPTVGRRLAELIPDATLRTIDTDDHTFAPVHAAEVAALIEEHVARAAVRRTARAGHTAGKPTSGAVRPKGR
jgi:pimeloyl-ACP methyl ester carboxylesterase